MNLYRNKYLIGIYTYDIYETCITVLENAKQFADFVKTNQNTANAILSKLYNKKTLFIVINSKKYKVCFILD